MLELARAVGFHTLVATPHLEGPLAPSYRGKVEAALDDVRTVAADVGVRVELGFEIQLTPDLVRRLEGGEPVTLGGSRAVLVELPFAAWPLHTEHTLFDLQTAGFQPVLAHPERYAEVQANPERAIGLAERGILLQATIGSAVGLFGRRAQQVTEELLRRDAVAVLATDAHSAGRRFVSVTAGLTRVRALIGPDRLGQLVADNPAALLGGDPLPPRHPLLVPPEADGLRKKLRRVASKLRA